MSLWRLVKSYENVSLPMFRAQLNTQLEIIEDSLEPRPASILVLDLNVIKVFVYNTN